MSAGPLAIDHVGLAVPDLEEAVALHGARLGLAAGHRELLPAEGLEVAFFDLGGSSLELLAPTDPDTSLARFLGRRGPGLHHLAYRVADLEAELRLWRERGAELIDTRPRPGARGRLVAFLHPRSLGGVLTELCQLPPEPR